MTNRTALFINMALVLAALALGIYFYPLLPDQVASHWDINGEANGWTSKFWGIFLLPIIMVFCLALFIVIPKIDPLKENIRAFGGYYNGVIVSLLAFFLYIHILTLLWNNGLHLDMGRWMAPVFGLLFFYIGHALPHTKRNWTMGIRTPWTLSSDVVWKKTHILAGKLFMVTGVFTLFGFILGDAMSFYLVIVPVILSALGAVIYSYFAFRKESKESKNS